MRSVIALGVLAVAISPAQAAIIVLDAVDSGTYTNTGFHDPNVEAYLVGRLLFGTELRNFFVFDLSGIAPGSITSATLRLAQASDGYISPDPLETYVLWDVSTPVSALVAGGTSRVDIFNDLGGTSSYGGKRVAAGGGSIDFPLSTKAVLDMNQSSGLFALGGQIQTLRPITAVPLEETIFGTPAVLQRQLILDAQFVIPEPSTLAMLSVACLFGLGYLRRCRPYCRRPKG